MINFVSDMGTNPNRETTFRFKRFAVRNSNSAMKVGTDGVLLGAWCGVEGVCRALDVGTGTGLIALMLAQRSADMFIMAIDVMPEAAEEAVYNAGQSPWADRIDVRCLDFKSLCADDCGVFDLIVSNPPFYKADVKSPDYARRMARHGDGLDFCTLISACSAGLLSREGRLAMILPAVYDQDVIFEAEMSRMKVVRKTSVFTKIGAPSPSRTLWELSFEARTCAQYAGLTVGSEQYRSLTDAFYL